MICPNCRSPIVQCPECGRNYDHGEATHCEEEACRDVNAPLDCAGCHLVVGSVDGSPAGVMTLEWELIPYGRKR